MTILSVTDASRMAGVSRQVMYEKINNGEINRTSEGIAVSELIRIYPNLKPLANLKIREVKKVANGLPPASRLATSVGSPIAEPVAATVSPEIDVRLDQTLEHAGTVELLVRELEWNKDLLEKTNQLMAKQLADQRALIADQARRLDEKDHFWARQVEIAQSLLPAPVQVSQKRRKIFGIF